MTPHGQPPPPMPGPQFGPPPLPYPVESDDSAIGYADHMPPAHPLAHRDQASAMPMNPMPMNQMPANPTPRPYRAGLRDPYTGEEFSDKSAVVGGVLQLFLGGFGAGRFYLGHHRLACAQFAVTIVFLAMPVPIVETLMFLAVSMWAFIDALVIFTGNAHDDRGRRVR